MTLETLYGVIPEGCTLEIEDECGNVLASYDGRDSIPEELNGRQVASLHPIDGFTLAIEVD